MALAARDNSPLRPRSLSLYDLINDGLRLLDLLRSGLNDDLLVLLCLAVVLISPYAVLELPDKGLGLIFQSLNLAVICLLLLLNPHYTGDRLLLGGIHDGIKQL